MGHSEVTVRDMYCGYRIGFKLPIKVHVCMMTAVMKLTNPDIDGMLLFSGTDYNSNANNTDFIAADIVRDTFVKLDAQWIVFHARQISQQSMI